MRHLGSQPFLGGRMPSARFWAESAVALRGSQTHLGLTISSSAWRITWRKRLPMLRARRRGHPSDGARGRSFAAVSPQRLSAMNDVTRILAAIEHGDPKAAEQLLPLVYDELRKLAAQRLV